MGRMGIDPGTAGGVAFIGDDGSVRLWPMPETRYERVEMLREWVPRADVVRVELVRSSTQMGVRSAFTFGGAYEGPIHAVLALGGRLEEVTPTVWQRAVGAPQRASVPKAITDKKERARLNGKAQREHKHALLNLAGQLFGARIVEGRLTLKTADALLIASTGEIQS